MTASIISRLLQGQFPYGHHMTRVSGPGRPCEGEGRGRTARAEGNGRDALTRQNDATTAPIARQIAGTPRRGGADSHLRSRGIARIQQACSRSPMSSSRSLRSPPPRCRRRNAGNGSGTWLRDLIGKGVQGRFRVCGVELCDDHHVATVPLQRIDAGARSTAPPVAS